MEKKVFWKLLATLVVITICAIMFLLSFDNLPIPMFSNLDAKRIIKPKVYPPQLSEEQVNKLQAALTGASDEKTIIDWYPRQNRSYDVRMQWYCGNCVLTTNRTKIHLPNTAAIVFLFRFVKPETMPSNAARRTDQLYVWQVGEAPPSLLYMSKTYLLFEDEYGFNATLSYRRDADFRYPYGTAHRAYKRVELMRIRNQPLANKSRLAIAVVSNCDDVPGAKLRLQLLKNLSSAGLSIDLFGACFGDKTLPKGDRKKFELFLRQYKFYFAFENSYHCRDYVTEKFFQNALETGAVPVVWGPTKEDLVHIAPPGSYIHTDDFSSAKLIDYLNYLDKNNTAYLEYFRWYSMDENKMPGFGQTPGYCQLCRAVHGINVDDLFNPVKSRRPLFSNNTTRRTLPSLRRWYFGKENKECSKPG